MKKSQGFGVLAVFLSCACGAPDETDAGPDATASTQQFLEWNPNAALVNEHVAWHQICGSVPGARSCNLMGEDFLNFHRNFMDRLRDDFTVQGLSADTAGWTTLPPIMKMQSLWTPERQAAENNINAGIDPATGTTFASLDRFGEYVEQEYHNYLHPIAVAAFGEAVVGGWMSPKSTYFLNIHGYIDLLYQRFQRGDFNKDGRSDLLVRSEFGGSNKIYLMNGAVLSQSVNIDALSSGAPCNFYVGATTDLNLDGQVDLVWHGPGCSQTLLWRMNGTTHVGDTQLPGVDSNWKLIGSGDFNQDGRPDLVWRHIASNDVVFWHMNGTTAENYHLLAPVANHTPVAVGDVNDDLIPDVILKQAGSPVVYRYWKGALNHTMGTANEMPGTGTSWSVGGVGRFHHGGGAGDLMFFEGGTSDNVSLLARLISMSGGQANYSFATGPIVPGYNVIQGPR